jgi:hypothetical protein
MLRPTKHLDLDASVLSVSAQILRLLYRRRIMRYDELYGRLRRRIGDAARTAFLPALGFLYLLGRLEYHEGSDTFEIVDRGPRGDADDDHAESATP